MQLERLKNYFRSVGIYFAALLIPMVVLVLINPLIAMNMSPEDYAVSGYYNSFSGLFTPLIVFYMVNYYSKRYFEVSDEDRLRLRAVLFKSLIFFSFIVAVLCLAGLLVYILLIKKDFSFPIFPHIALAVFAIPLSGIYKLEQTECRMARDASGFFKITVAAGVVLVLSNLLFVVALKWGSFGRLLAPFTANAIIFVYLIVRHRDLFKISFSFKEFRTVLWFCLPLALGAMLGYFFNGYDRTYLEGLGDVTQYGHYIVGAQIAGYLSVFSTAITSTFQPDIYEAVAKRDNRAFFSTCLLQVGLIALVVIVFILFCPLIIRLVTAGRYMLSVPYARIVSLSVLMSSIYYVINNYTIAKGYPRLYLYTTVIATVLTVLAYPPMVSRFGYSGGAHMTWISFVLLALINLVLLGAIRLMKKRN